MDRRKSDMLLASTAARGNVSGASNTVDNIGTNTSQKQSAWALENNRSN